MSHSQWTAILWFFLLKLFLSPALVAMMCRNKLILQPTCVDCGYGSPLNVHSNIASVVACSEICSGHPLCRSFHYNPASHECCTNAERRDPQTINTACSNVVKYGYIEKAACRSNEVWMFSPCSGVVGCPMANSECRGGQCVCRFGYPYDYRTDSCPAVCTKYGTSLTLVTYYLTLHNTEKFTTWDKNYCFQRCFTATGYRFVFIEYDHYLHECLLSVDNARTAASSVVHETDNNYEQWDRNCA